jgi:hypothetical protein
MKVDVFFEMKPAHLDPGNRARLYDDQDILPLTELQNAFVIYKDDDKAIVQYRADNMTIAELQDQSECADPLSQEAVDILGITGKYLGRTIDDVFVKYPELAGTRTVETEDGDIEVDIVRRIS